MNNFLKDKKFLIVLVLILVIVVSNVAYKAHQKTVLNKMKTEWLSKYPLIKEIVDINIPSGDKGYHNSIILKDRKFLLIDGADIPNIGLYDPEKNKFEVVGKTSQEFKFYPNPPHVFELSDKKVLFLSSATFSSFNKKLNESVYKPNYIGIFDIKTKKFSIRKLNLFRRDFTATLLNNGKILLAGGYDKNNKTLKSQLLDSQTGKLSLTGDTIYPEFKSNTVLLPDGNVLFVGSICSPDNAELYVTKLGKFIKIGDLKEKSELSKENNKEFYDFVNVEPYLLPNGNVLIINSTKYQENPLKSYIKSIIEIYDTKSKKFSYITDLKTKFSIYKSSSYGILITDNKFLVLGYPDDTSIICEPFSSDNLKKNHLIIESLDLKTKETKIIGNLPYIQIETMLLKDKELIIYNNSLLIPSDRRNSTKFVLSVKNL